MKKCLHCGITESCQFLPYKNGFLCNKHYIQMKRHGRFMERTVKDPNKVVIKDDHAKMYLYDVKGECVGKTLIDVDDLDDVLKYKWRLSNGYVGYKYASRRDRETGKNVFLHRQIMNPPDDMVVDHKNHDRLDNRRSNLRVCTRCQNQANMKTSKNNSIGYKGVARNGSGYMANIAHNRRTYYLGTYRELEDAAIAYNKKAIELNGEFAYINKIDT